ncbi:uncharacterized protein LOC141595223 isoform X2 [Silene latifolia]|uniref:uncharacterized protein LOC141595223 isoform X2 n=1 Tax=Silene latifolia TaxID=37657 RepID=UPI003D77155C
MKLNKTQQKEQAVFVMSARICCGAKLAFGPVVLASIYSELTLLKKEILSGGDDGSRLFVSSPLHLVQVWAWERFPLLGPVPRMMDCGEVRLARWESHARKLCDDIDDVKMCLDSARENFRWRPYGMSIENWSLPRFYVNSGMWVVVDSDEEWKLFARCLMVGQLNGLDCVENYNPHRVALQFGFDQDIPKSSSYTLDEVGYRMDFEGLKMYLPPRLHEGDITSRYFDWWRKRFAQEEMALVGSKRKLRTRKRVKKIAKIFDRCDELKAIIVENVGMEEGDEDIELNRSIDQEEGGGMELAENEMLGERKQGCAAMTSACSQSASKHQNLENEIGTPTECSGTLIRVASNDEPAEALCRDPVDGPVAVSLPVMDKSDQKSFAARCVEYESRMSRLERMISATSVYKPT